jgi:hypothetical protein
VLDDLVGDAGRRAADVVGREDLAAGNENAPGRGREAAVRLGHACPFRTGLTGPASRSGPQFSGPQRMVRRTVPLTRTREGRIAPTLPSCATRARRRRGGDSHRRARLHVSYPCPPNVIHARHRENAPSGFAVGTAPSWSCAGDVGSAESSGRRRHPTCLTTLSSPPIASTATPRPRARAETRRAHPRAKRRRTRPRGALPGRRRSCCVLLLANLRRIASGRMRAGSGAQSETWVDGNAGCQRNGPERDITPDWKPARRRNGPFSRPQPTRRAPVHRVRCMRPRASAGESAKWGYPLNRRSAGQAARQGRAALVRSRVGGWP